jgi:hypothetical protein
MLMVRLALIAAAAGVLAGCSDSAAGEQKSVASDRGVQSKARGQSSGSLGFVVRHWYTAIYETKFMDECERGLNISNDEIWWRSLSKKDRAEKTQNGLLETLRRWQPAVRRGPNGEDVCLDPTVVTDPPFITVNGDVSYGVNLDGTTDGKATPKTCAHQKFRGLNGEPAVDNQLYRLLGCTYGWRSNGIFEVNADEMRGTSGLAMILIEVTGVDDPRNDDDVTVTFYRSIDQFPQDSSGKPIPFSSYRIDTKPDGTPRYGDSLRGRIENGVIKAGSGDVRLPFYGNYTFSQHNFKDMSIELTISEDGKTADGMVYGYYDVEEFLYHVTGTGVVISTAGFSCPALFAAAWELADGYPDPETGRCTALSSAFKINTYAAHVVKPQGVTVAR